MPDQTKDVSNETIVHESSTSAVKSQPSDAAALVNKDVSPFSMVNIDTFQERTYPIGNQVTSRAHRIRMEAMLIDLFLFSKNLRPKKHPSHV
jgi:hypothetical protein